MAQSRIIFRKVEGSELEMKEDWLPGLLLVGFMLMIVMGVAIWMFARPARDDALYRPGLAEAVYWTIGGDGAAGRRLSIHVGAWAATRHRRWRARTILGTALLVVNMWSRVRMPITAPWFTRIPRPSVSITVRCICMTKTGVSPRRSTPSATEGDRCVCRLRLWVAIAIKSAANSRAAAQISVIGFPDRTVVCTRTPAPRGRPRCLPDSCGRPPFALSCGPRAPWTLC
jgi:hypothetical protein